mmetsp:Transcript_165405/g.530760  ORF Transcript_165405/g.530760 Transcript_165405/m.530760 type:complete len:435 (-) Transcript_165405:105-1409(-)
MTLSGTHGFPVALNKSFLRSEPESANCEQGRSGTASLQTRHVAALAFAMTCAGPFGIEGCLRTFGAAWSCIGVILASLLYVGPQILVTAELSMIAPLSNGGVVSWVDRAFGSTAAATVALNMIVYQLVDLATYPSVVVGYAQQLDADVAPWVLHSCPYVIIVLGLVLNLFDLRLATEMYSFMLVIILMPFVVGLVLSEPSWPYAWAAVTGAASATLQPAQGGLRQLNLFLSTMLWLSSGWDAIGSLAQEVAGPGALIRGLALAMLAGPVVYIGCTFGALAAGPGSWEDGYLAVAYGKFWPPLTPWIVFAGSLSNFLLYISELSCLARLIQSLGIGGGSSQLLNGFRSRPSCTCSRSAWPRRPSRGSSSAAKALASRGCGPFLEVSGQHLWWSCFCPSCSASSCSPRSPIRPWSAGPWSATPDLCYSSSRCHAGG